MNKPKVVNLLAGPGTGKSTTCAALFAELKYSGYNTEMVLEYAKGAAWEQRLVPGSKISKAQEYIFGKQHFGLSRVASEVDFCITDAPLILGLVYMQDDSPMPSLRNVILESYHNYDNLNIFLNRSSEKAYNPKGRTQTESEAIELDNKIKNTMIDLDIPFTEIKFDRNAVGSIMWEMNQLGWISHNIHSQI